MAPSRNFDVTENMTPPTVAPKFHPDFRPRWLLLGQLHYHFHGNVLNLIPEKIIRQLHCDVDKMLRFSSNMAASRNDAVTKEYP